MTTARPRNFTKARMQGMADALAILLVYMTTIEDSIDVFTKRVQDMEFDEAWDILALIARAKSTAFSNIGRGAIESEWDETGRIKRAVKDGRDINVRDMLIYADCMNRVRQFVAGIADYEYIPAEVRNGTFKPDTEVAGIAPEGGVSGGGSGEVEPARQGQA